MAGDGIKQRRITLGAHKALEMAMRDALDGLEELSTLSGYESAGGFEILSITPPPDPAPAVDDRPLPLSEIA